MSYTPCVDAASITNCIITNESYGKNVRLMHLKNLIGNAYFNKIADFGCGNGFLLHNLICFEPISTQCFSAFFLLFKYIKSLFNFK